MKLNFFFFHYRLARDQSGYNFDFRLLYKVLPRETAVVRFGGIKNEGEFVETVLLKEIAINF